MGGASRLKMLLSSPFIIYHPTRPSSALRLLRISSSTFSSPLKFLSTTTTTTTTHRPSLLLSTNSFHTHFSDPTPHPSSHPFPEWPNFLDNLKANGYFNRHQLNGEDALSVFDNLPQHFLTAATASIFFARERPYLLGSLSRKDIEIIVENGSPFLFQTAVDTATRMKSFLANNQNNELVLGRASMVDLMRFLLSYMYHFTVSDQNKLSSGEFVESSVRNLLRELAYESRVVDNQTLSFSEPKQLHDGYGQSSRPLRQNIEMKRGDWVCPKCTFMNFARNMNCLECDEARPERQLTDGEWNCPQCNFFNYGKNVVCLRCDCKRPGEGSVPAGPRFGFERNNENMAATFDTQRTNLEPRMTNAGTSGVSRNLDRILGRTSEERRSDYVPFNNSNQSSSAEEEQGRGSRIFPAAARKEPMSFDNPMDNLPFSGKPVKHTELKEDKGDNRFLASKKNDRSLTPPPHKRRMAMEQTTNATNFVPFVPFPPDYFAKKNKVPEAEAPTVIEASGTSASAGPEVAAERNTGVLDAGTVGRLPQIHGNENSSENRVDYSYGRPRGGSTQMLGNEHYKKESWGTSFSGNNSTQNRVDYSSKGPSVSSTDFGTGSREGRSNASWEDSRSHTESSTGNSTQQPENGHNTKESWRGGFSGKSLEGSLVKEPDPLDMSEEAKAERWFRRVAQIKDISELSQIPDEDFPQIMPMRKGVNRFVVSKRKTPLERRLTSPQYRRNLPTVSSEPLNNADTES